MRSILWVMAAALSVTAPGSATAQPFPQPGPFPQRNLVPVYRYFHPGSSDHLYTVTPEREAQEALRQYIHEGQPFALLPRQVQGTVPLYRFFKPSGGHFYATTPRVNRTFNNEGVLGYLSERPARGLVPLYMWYRPQDDRHFYTIDDQGELASLVGYEYHGIVGYVVPGQ